MSMTPDTSMTVRMEQARERGFSKPQTVKVSDTTFVDPPAFGYPEPLPAAGPDPDGRNGGKPSQEQELRHKMATYNHKLLAEAAQKKGAILSELATVLSLRKDQAYHRWQRHSFDGNKLTREQLEAANESLFESRWDYFNSFVTNVQQFLEETLVKTINDSRLQG